MIEQKLTQLRESWRNRRKFSFRNILAAGGASALLLSACAPFVEPPPVRSVGSDPANLREAPASLVASLGCEYHPPFNRRHLDLAIDFVDSWLRKGRPIRLVITSQDKTAFFPYEAIPGAPAQIKRKFHSLVVDKQSNQVPLDSKKPVIVAVYQNFNNLGPQNFDNNLNPGDLIIEATAQEQCIDSLIWRG